MKRTEIIKKYIEGKNVLDIGCIGDFSNLNFFPIENGTAPLHFIELNAKSYTGIDYDVKRVKELNDKGYNNIITADAQNFALNERFDVVFAGELIEHLANPGEFLSNVYKHMKDDGYFILSTPNVFSINHLIKGLFGMKITPYHEHTHWHCEKTLTQLLKLYKFEIIEKHFLNEDYKINKIKYLIMKLICFNKKWRQTMMFVCKK